MPAESCAEGACRAVTDTFSDLGYAEVRTAEQIFCDGHAPREEVFHGRHTHGAREALEERRARERQYRKPLGTAHVPSIRAPLSARVIGFVQARSWYQDLTPIVVTSPPN